MGQDGVANEFVPDDFSMIYGQKTNLYGGKLCENVVQATARDLLVEAILRLEKAGLPVLFHVHDEVIVEVSESEVDYAKQVVEAEMSRQPMWAPGLPVKCEVQTAAHYTK